MAKACEIKLRLEPICASSSIIRKLKLRLLDVPKQANDNDAFEDIRPKIWIRIP